MGFVHFVDEHLYGRRIHRIHVIGNLRPAVSFDEQKQRIIAFGDLCKQKISPYARRNVLCAAEIVPLVRAGDEVCADQTVGGIRTALSQQKFCEELRTGNIHAFQKNMPLSERPSFGDPPVCIAGRISLVVQEPNLHSPFFRLRERKPHQLPPGIAAESGKYAGLNAEGVDAAARDRLYLRGDFRAGSAVAQP